MAEESIGEFLKKGETVKKPQRTVSYTGEYPKMPEFERPWEVCMQVGQGSGKLSLDRRPLQSEGFSKCSGLILKNESTLESALFHIDDIDLGVEQTPVVRQFITDYINSLDLDQKVKTSLLSAASDLTKRLYPKAMKREELQKIMEELNRDGVLKAQYIVGSNSGRSKDRIVGSLLGYLGVGLVDDISVDTGNAHWAVVYKPNDQEIFVDARSQKKVFIYSF